MPNIAKRTCFVLAMLLSQHVVTCSVRVMYLLTIIFHFTIHASLTFTCPRFLTSVIRLFGYIFFSLSSYYILLKFRFKACLSIPFPPLWSIWKSILTKSFFYTFASSVNFPSYSANLISIHVDYLMVGRNCRMLNWNRKSKDKSCKEWTYIFVCK